MAPSAASAQSGQICGGPTGCPSAFTAMLSGPVPLQIVRTVLAPGTLRARAKDGAVNTSTNATMVASICLGRCVTV
ncbi:hypothetical protein ACEWPM_002895 [Roseovarius sp. S4756]|uniref:hypothetical protein n=1 Tax=Roseovarius maritimus TaxID=3342637 RepID=UPI00372AC893